MNAFKSLVILEINLLMISTIAVPCLATHLGSSSTDVESTSTISSIARWIKLYNHIHNNVGGKQLDLMELTTILNEMYEIELTEAYKLGLKPLIETDEYGVKQYKDLIDKFHAAHLMKKTDSSLTDLLLQTFDHNSNHCTAEYFELSIQILKSFEQTSISNALHENRNLQYRNCWRRFVHILDGNAMFLGSVYWLNLNKLALLVYPVYRHLPALDADSSIRRIESRQIVKIIAQFSKYQNNSESDAKNGFEFQNQVGHPCKLLIDATKQILIHIFKLLTLIGDEKNILTGDSLTTLRKYLFCDRIVNDFVFIRSSVKRYIDRINKDRSEAKKSSHSGRTKEKISNKNISTELMLGFPGHDESQNLITQHLSPHNEETCSIEQLEEPDAMQPVLSESQVNEDDRKVLQINGSVGYNKATKYLTVWSDGSTSEETKKFLLANCPQLMKNFLKKRSAVYQSKYTDRQIAKDAGRYDLIQDMPDYRRSVAKRPRIDGPERTTLTLPPTDSVRPQEDNIDDARVIHIGAARGRGLYARYPTKWSDGRETYETREFLLENWLEVWVHRFDPE